MVKSRGRLKLITRIMLLCLGLALAVLALPSASVFGEDAQGVVVELMAGTGEFDLVDGTDYDSGFRFPYGMTIDRDGALLVADSYNNAIRRIADGKIVTIAGGYDQGTLDAYGFPKGLYMDANAGAARFNRPRSIAVDSKGAVFVADTENHSIRKIEGGKVVTWAGNGTAGYKNGKAMDVRFNYPSSVVIDSENNIYVSDTLNHCIRKIAPDGEVSLYAGVPGKEGSYKDGNIRDARFNKPAGLALDKAGNLYVADSGNQVIRKISANEVSTLAGTSAFGPGEMPEGALNDGGRIDGTGYYKGGYRDGSRETALFNFPKGITVTENGTVIVADTWNHSIRAIKPDGMVITIAGTGKAGDMVGPAAQAMFNGPADVAYSSGYLYISDMWNNSIKRIRIDEDKLVPVGSKYWDGVELDPVAEKVQVWVDGFRVDFPDVQPYVEDGLPFMPIRFVLEAWGATVEWQQQTSTVMVNKGPLEIQIPVSEKPVVSKGGRTMANTRYLADEFGFLIEWVAEYRAVIILTH